MLLRQHGRGHEHGDLPAVHHRLERGANGHFRFPVAGVAANQAVHRFGAFHVRLHLADGAELIGRFLVDERALEFALPGRVPGERVAGLRFARSLDGQQLGGDVAHGAFGLLLRLFPARSAERVEWRTRFPRADVFADEMGLGYRHVKFRRRLGRIARRVFDHQTFDFRLRMADGGWVCARHRGRH